MITTTTGCWTLNDPNGGLAMWENARHMPTWEESENYRIYLGLSVNRHYTYRVDQPCHVVTCDECGPQLTPRETTNFATTHHERRGSAGHCPWGGHLSASTWCAAPASGPSADKHTPSTG